MSSLERHLTKLLTLCFTFLLGPMLVVGGHTKIQTIFHKNLWFGNKKRHWRKCGTFLWGNFQTKMIRHLGTEFFSHVFFLNLDFEFQYDLSGCYYIERRASIASGIIVVSSLLLSKGHDTFAIAIISTMNKSVWYSKIAIVEMKDSFKGCFA